MPSRPMRRARRSTPSSRRTASGSSGYRRALLRIRSSSSGRPRSVFDFGLTNTHWDPTATGVVRLRSERLRSVKAEDGTSLPFHHDRGSLLVGLPAPAAVDTPFKLAFEIEGDFLVRPQGDNFWLLEGNWLPLPQQTGRSFTMRATVRVKKPFLPFAPGVTKSRRVDGDENVVETEIADPVDFPVVLAGNYRYEEETREGMTVRVASYAMNRPKAFKKLSNLAFSVIKYYEGFLGPFPFRELNIIEINDYGWGQAPPGTLFITQEAFNPIMGEANQLFSGGVNHRFAHEIAHQYWGTVVKSPSPEEQWLGGRPVAFSGTVAASERESPSCRPPSMSAPGDGPRGCKPSRSREDARGSPSTNGWPPLPPSDSFRRRSRAALRRHESR
jgi:hypothetical protein